MNAAPATTTLQNEATAKTAPEINLDSGEGKPLAQLLSALNADVEWSNEKLSELVVKGRYHGSPAAIAQALLGDLNYAVFHDHARLRIVVMPKTPKVEMVKLASSPPQAVKLPNATE